MVINTLELKNFKRYKDAKFNFNLGLTGLIGKNGSGKSTIFEAIIFALYGRGNSVNELLKNSKAPAKEPLIVKLFFTIEGIDYLIERELRGKSLTAKANLYKGDGELIATGVKEVTKEIIKLIGMSQDAFSHTIYASQKELNALSKLKSEERKKIIRKLIGLEKIDTIEKELIFNIRDLKRDIKSFIEVLMPQDEIDTLKKEQNSLQKELKSLDTEIENSKIKLTKIVQSIDKILKELEKWQLLKDSFNSLKKQFEIDSNKLKNFTTNLQNLENKLTQIKEQEIFYNKNKSVKKEFKELEEALKNIQELKEKTIKKEALLKEQKELREQYSQIKKEIENLKSKIDKKDEFTKAYEKNQKSLEEILKQLNELEKKEQELQKRRFEYLAIVKNSKKQLESIQKLGKNSPCPTCTRALLDEYENVVENLSKTIDTIVNGSLKEIDKELLILKSQKEQLSQQKESFTKAQQEIITKLELIKSFTLTLQEKSVQLEKISKKGQSNNLELERLKEINYNSKEHSRLLEKKEKLLSRYQKVLKLEKFLEQKKSLLKEIEDSKKEIKELEDKLKKLEQSIKTHSYNSQEEARAKEDYKNLSSQKEKLLQILKQKEIKRAQIESKIGAIADTLNRNSKNIEKLNAKKEDLKDLEILKELLSDFKTKINSQISPRISAIASKMFFELTKGKYQLIEVDSDFNFFIYDEGKKYPIERFSGGEIDLANLVLRIAISKVLNELSSNTNISFLAFDEIFGSQDEERRYAIMEAFNKIKESYRQIFLISHESEIKEMFEHIIEL